MNYINEGRLRPIVSNSLHFERSITEQRAATSHHHESQRIQEINTSNQKLLKKLILISQREPGSNFQPL